MKTPNETASDIIELAKSTNRTPWSIFLLIKDHIHNVRKVENLLLDHSK
jgi:hypothetical protein